MAMKRTFTYTNHKGRDIKYFTTTFQGRRTTFEFPYTTDDQDEINYLTKIGAVGKRPTPVKKKEPKPEPEPVMGEAEEKVSSFYPFTPPSEGGEI